MRSLRPARRAACAAAVLCSLCLATAGGGCAPTPDTEPMPVADTSEANLRAINALVGEFVHAMNTEDVDAFVGLFTPRAIRLPPHAAAIEGHGAIRAQIANTFRDNAVEVFVQLEESRFSGDMGVVRGTWSLKLTAESSGLVSEDVGKWMNLVERQANGRWRISRNMWNSNLPMPSPGES